MEQSTEKNIILGGGCFWCIEAVFLEIPGVKAVLPGYTGGSLDNPSYEQVSGGNTGHAEVIKVTYDNESGLLKKILDIFFTVHNPTTLNRQGNDVGAQYRSVIFWEDEEQEKIIIDFIAGIKDDFTDPIVTEISKLDKFYPAEEYHHRYFAKHPENAYCSVVIAPKVKKAKDKIKNPE